MNRRTFFGALAALPVVAGAEPVASGAQFSGLWLSGLEKSKQDLVTIRWQKCRWNGSEWEPYGEVYEVRQQVYVSSDWKPLPVEGSVQ